MTNKPTSRYMRSTIPECGTSRRRPVNKTRRAVCWRPLDSHLTAWRPDVATRLTHGALRAREMDRFEIQLRPALFSLDARVLDHSRPLCGGIREDRSEFRRRAAKHRAAQLDDPAFDFVVGETGIELLVQHTDDFGRGV